MAAAVTSLQLIEEGWRNYVVKFDVDLDGSSTDLTSTKVVDTSTFSQIYIHPPKLNAVRIDRIEYIVGDGIYLSLFWDATTPKRIVDLAGRGMIDPGMRYGGLQNNATGGGITGNITATTTGAGTTKVTATIILHCVKVPLVAITNNNFVIQDGGAGFILTDSGSLIVQDT